MNNSYSKQAAALGGVYDASSPVASNFSYWNTVNPLASMFNGNIRIPEWWAKAWGVTDAGKKGAVISGNIIGSAGALALLVAAARGTQFLSRLAKFRESDDTAADMAKQLSSTYSSTKADKDDKKRKKDGSIAKHASEDESYIVDRNKLSNLGAIILASSVPMIGFMAGTGAYKASNNVFNKLRNDYISESVDEKSKQVSNLMRIRAALARGKMTPDEARKAVVRMADGESYIKNASQEDGQAGSSLWDWLARTWQSIKSVPSSENLATALSGASLILLGLFGSTAIGAYHYFKAKNDKNRRFEAFNKGLREFAKSKATTSPVGITDVEQNVYEGLDDEDEDKKKPARNEPEYAFSTVSKPVSITL